MTPDAPEAQGVRQGKCCQRYEFGVKVGIAVIVRGGVDMGVRNLSRNPVDRATLAEQLEHAETLSGEKLHTAIVNLSDRGRSFEGFEILRRGKP